MSASTGGATRKKRTRKKAAGKKPPANLNQPPPPDAPPLPSDATLDQAADLAGLRGKLPQDAADKADRLVTGARPKGSLPPLPGETGPKPRGKGGRPKGSRNRAKARPPEIPDPTLENCYMPWGALSLVLTKLGATPFTQEELDTLAKATLPVAVKYKGLLAYPEPWLALTVCVVVGPKVPEVAKAMREKREKRRSATSEKKIEADKAKARAAKAAAHPAPVNAPPTE